MIKRKMIMHGVLLVLVLAILVSASLAYFTNIGTQNQVSLIGDVEVEAILYYEKSGVGCTNDMCPIEEVVVDEALNITKDGVYYINVTNPNSIQYIENFRIKFNIKSNVDTYLRIKVIENLTLISENIEGVRTEIPITDEPTIFNYDAINWSINEDDIFDDYYYYKTPVKRIDETTDLVVPFISSYFSGINYNPLTGNYFIQIAIRVEAVQALNGPQIRWGLETPPWGGEW